MPIITISHDYFTHGREIAENVADRLNYECLGPEVIRDACEKYNLPARAFRHALKDPPSILERLFSTKKERYVSMFRVSFFEHMRRDNIVYHGLAGHVFLADVPNVFRVRITTDIEERIRERMRRNRINDNGKAIKQLGKEDTKRMKWTRYLYGRSNHDPGLYDIYINLHTISVDMAADIIVKSVKISTNGQVPQMLRRLDDLALKAKVESCLLQFFPEVEVNARDGEVFVKITAPILQEDAVIKKAKKAISKINSIKAVNIGVMPSIYLPC